MANTNKCDMVGDKVKVVTGAVKVTAADGVATLPFDDVDTVTFDSELATLEFEADGMTYATTVDDDQADPLVFTITDIDPTA